MLKTSYFAKSAKEAGAVSIARFPPRGYTGKRYFRLAPTPGMLKLDDWEEYTKRYREEILSGLDPGEVLRELDVAGAGHDVILLCFEKDRAHCHRGLVAEWFNETIGLEVPEVGSPSTVQVTL